MAPEQWTIRVATTAIVTDEEGGATALWQGLGYAQHADARRFVK